MLWIIGILAVLHVLDCWWLTWSLALLVVGFLAFAILKAAAEGGVL